MLKKILKWFAIFWVGIVGIGAITTMFSDKKEIATTTDTQTVKTVAKQKVDKPKAVEKKNNPFITEFKKSGSVTTGKDLDIITNVRAADTWLRLYQESNYTYKGKSVNSVEYIPFEEIGKIKLIDRSDKGKTWYRVSFGGYSNKWWRRQSFYNKVELDIGEKYDRYMNWGFPTKNDAENFVVFLEYLIGNFDSIKSKLIRK